MILGAGQVILGAGQVDFLKHVVCFSCFSPHPVINRLSSDFDKFGALAVIENTITVTLCNTTFSVSVI